MEVQGSAQSSDADKESQEDSQESNKANNHALKRPTSNKTISAHNRLTIYFHAVLSKDFKFNPGEDLIFIRAGCIIGTWEHNAVQLSVTRDLGEHGFLVEGCVLTSKTDTESQSIPYKYVVYNRKKRNYEYEFIYKLDSEQLTNRCLFVKPHLLNSDGDWHQYDDIICAPPSKNLLKSFAEHLKEKKFWLQTKQSLIQSRQIAGTVMLEGIFDLLRSWTSVNLRNFWAQLSQFFEVYGDPCVFEEKQKRWHSLEYGKDDVRKMLKEFMLTNLIPQLLKEVEGRMHFTEDPVRAAVIMLSVCTQYNIRLVNAECVRLCTQLCLPNLQKEDFIIYWTHLFQDVPFIRNLPGRLVALINTVKTEGNTNWLLVLPLLHLLNGSTKLFETQTHVNIKFDLSWAGLDGLKFGPSPSSSMNSQQRRALVKLIKNKSHLIKVDPLLMRSCLYLIPFDELKECGVDLDVELLDILQVFFCKAPSEISYSTVEEASGILSHIHGKLIEEKYSRFTEGYRKSCLVTAVKLLEKLCRAVRPSTPTQNFPEVPVACMNVVASVSDFAYYNKQQETPEGETAKDYAKDLISQASSIMRRWLSQSFRQNWSSWSPIKTEEVEIWNNIISIHFNNDDCTKQWKQTFKMDFQDKYRQESAVDQIEFYCKNIEDLHKSHPHVAACIENCALEAVPSLCQSRSEATLSERINLNWFGKFGKLISGIIEKSWPRDGQGNHQEDEEAVLNHLLSWAAAKNILQLYAEEENLIEKLSEDATDRVEKAIATFKVITSQLIQGSIRISLLKIILKKSDAFLDLLQIDCLCENTHDKYKMKRLIQCRQREMNAVYHEKELIDLFITMSHKLEEHMAVDIAEMEERQQVNIEIHPLNVFMEVYLFDQMACDKTGVVTYFKLDKDTRDMAEVLHTFQDSHLFKMCWEKQAKLLVADGMDAGPDMEEMDIVATPEMIHDDIFEPSFDEYKNIHTCLKNGHITLAQVNELFGDYTGKYDELTQELDIMCRVEKLSDRQWIHRRVQQIEQYHELHLAVASAEIIMMVKETLCLQGDFRVLETLTEANHADFQKEQLNRIDNDLMQAKKVLVHITEPRALCLRELGLQKNFVIWVKDALEDINELKVFVDLATISAGENDMDMDRVACFHDAVLGYSSVLYELKPDSGFNVFQDVLKKLWKALDNDCNIPKKLRDSARHLEWLKTVKDSHGQVESENLARVYHEKESSSCLTDFIVSQTKQEVHCYSTFTEVTTFSRLLTASDIEPLEKMMHSVELLSLQQFDTEHSFLKKIRNFLTAEDGSPGMGTCDKVLIIQSDFDEASPSANLIASAKYLSINEINKITQQNTEMKVFVYFITRLPRMEGGTSYIGFHGSSLRAAHIDDLRQSKDIVSDIKVFQNMTISQMFETENSEPEAMEVDDMYTENEQKEADVEENGCHQVVDTTALVRSCVQSAVGMLRDQVESGVRSTRRVEILLTLLSDDDEIKGEFLQTVKKHLHLLLSTQDSNTFPSDRSNWVIKEASNFDALQKGGTLRHTLWKRIQAAVVPFLAQLVSVIDRDQNLDLLLDSNCGQSVKRLWLDIFGNDKLLEILHPRADHNFDTRTILVQNYIVQDRNMRCCMPFSWRIKNYLEELWVHALYHEDRTQKEFDEFFWKTPLGRYIKKTDLEMQTEFFQRYLQDFICMTMNVTCQEDLQLLCGALSCCVSELRVQLDAMDAVISLPWIHAAYNKFKNRLQNLSRMICIEPQVIQHLSKNQHSRPGDEMVLDVYAAFACVEYLEPRNLDTDIQRQAWLGLVKKLQVPIELICSEDSVKHYGERSKALVRRVQTGWNRISSLTLFVENILLGIEEVEERLTPLVLGHTRRLAQMLEKNSDLKSHQAFEEVITLLKSCKDGAVKHIFRFGMSQCPVCMGDPQDPLCLPCEHIYCLACLKEWLRPGQMYCPLCIQEVDDNFPLVPSEDLRISLKQHAQFRKQCNAFFIDLVSSMCFKDNSPPSSTIIHHLLSFLMVEVKSDSIFRKGAGEQQMRTKMLSPFDDSVDKNPVVRSVVLKLLLKYSFDEVKGYLQQHLLAIEQSNILEKTDKTEVCLLYINCLEDSMYERFQFRTTAEQQVFLQEESVFLVDYQQLQSAEAITVEYLQHVARVRMDLDMAACLIVEKLKPTAQRTDNSQNRTTAAFLESVVNLCRRSGNDWYRVYLIRKISSQHGVEFVLKLLNEDAVRWLFQLEVLQKSKEVAPIDQYLVCGEHYKTIRDAVAKVVLEGQIEGLDKTCEGCECSPQQRTVYLLLALNREVTTLYRDVSANFHPKPEVVKILVAYIQASKFLTNPLVKAFAQALVTNQLGPLVVRPGASGADCVLVDLTIHLAAVLLCGGQGILAPLQQLAMQPANMQRAFLPTMADDMLVVAQQVLGLVQWYLCPNGHPCAIGECGQPMEQSRCVDCGVEIGGINNRPVNRFHAVQLQGDRTQTGHILGGPNRRDNADMLDTKGISPVPFTTIRMFTHMAMLLGAGSHLQFISDIIKPQVADPGTFLLAHLQKDLQHLIRSLGKGTDDTVSAVHLLIRSLLAPDLQKRGGLGDNLLSTKEARNRWETEVSNTVITPQLKHLDRQLKEVNAFIRADSRISANPVVKLLFGDPRLFLESLPQTSLIHSTSVWSCREKVSLLSLTHYVEQNDGKDNLPVLWRFLHKEAELRLVKHLPDILTLQRDLVKNFQNVTELACGTIRDFLHSQKTDSLKHRYHKYIELFLTTWNQLRVSLMTNGEIKLPAEYCQKDMDLNSDFTVLLPRRRGPGLCSTALVSYLIALHNDLVYCTDKHTGEETSYKVSPSDLTDLHVIRYELERDLMPLVLANTQYSIEKGQETLHEYDLSKIQQQIVARFLLGKPLITLNGIPTLVNRHDRNYEIILRDIKAKVPQEPLQTLILSDVAGELHSYSEVCDALSTLEVALGFLAMTGGEPHMQLSSYLEEVLQMGNQMAAHILKTLSICRLKHCVALWQLLASLKSENMLRLKRDPFVGVSDSYKAALGEEEQRLLTGFFSKNSADGFLLEIHEFLVLVLKKSDALDTFKPDWGLKETLEGYMDRKNLDVPPDVDKFFPEQILLSHCVEAWKFIVAFKQERHRH